MLVAIQEQFSRLRSRRISVEMMPGDAAVERVKLTVGARSCVVLAAGLLSMLKSLPDSAGSYVILTALRRSALNADPWAC
jgi:hypothetical protein